MSAAFQLGTMYWQNPKYGFEELDADLSRIKENNFSVIRVFIWWEQLERREGYYDFGMHDMLFEAASKHGLKVMDTFGLYLPFWLTKRLAEKGIEDKSRYWCFDRPEIAEPMGRYIDAVVGRYRDSDALAIWNLWNEPTKPPCHCEHTRAKFLDWVRERYKDIDSLRKAWCGECQVFDHMCPESMEELDLTWLDGAFRFGSRGRITPIEYDYREFSTVNLDQNIRWMRDRVKAIDPFHETHANPCMPTANGLHCGLDEWRLGRTLDSISVSVHPSHHFTACSKSRSDFPLIFSFNSDEARSWASGKDAWIGELQAGTTFFHPKDNCHTPSPKEISHCLWQALGRGMKGVLFWQWQSWRSSMMEVGEFSLREVATGASTDRSEAAAEVGRIIGAHHEAFAGLRRPPSKVAIFLSRDANKLKILQWKAKPHIHELDNEHVFAAFGCYRALNNYNISADFLNEEEIEAGALGDYLAVFMPHVEIMRPAVAAKLTEFVASGGYLWADGRCAFLDEHVYLRNTNPGHGLDKLFGCREADFLAAGGNVEMFISDSSVVKGLRHEQYLSPTSGSVTARFPNGRPAIVRNKFGKGVAELAGSYVTLGLRATADEQTMRHLASFAMEAGARPALEITPGFEACFLEGSEFDVMIVSSRPGIKGKAIIRLQGKYSSISSPMGGCILAGDTIEREFDDFETAIFICQK